MFRGRAQLAGFTPREGDKVEVRALVTLYGARGDTRSTWKPSAGAGVGALYEAFQRLKKAGRAGPVRPGTQACHPHVRAQHRHRHQPAGGRPARRLIALKRRAPHVNIILYPTPVQGQQAPEKSRTRSARRRPGPRRRAAGLPWRRQHRGFMVAQR